MVMALERHVGIFAFREGFERLLDDRGVRLNEEATVPVMGVHDGPVVGVSDFGLTMPDEAVELPPVASGFCGGFFRRQFAQRGSHAISPG